MKVLSAVALCLLLAVTWVVRVYHMGVLAPPKLERINESTRSARSSALWIDKAKHGMHQLVLFGAPYERGLEAGRLTQALLARQEHELNAQLKSIFPSDLLIRALTLLGIRWFHGIEKHLDPWMLEEMFGVSRSAPRDYDFIVDGYTRQLAYHGLHEVGQMMVDRGVGDDGQAPEARAGGCTVAAVPSVGSWVVGRNFDFEGGRTFDSEKIMKWVFPDVGNAFVSVIWAGMVGAVTGVNEKGLYLSINAAGSRDFRRHGTPSTLVMSKALQFADTAAEAIRIIENSTMFITDIFVLLDGRAGKLYRIEKSPRRTVTRLLDEPSVVTNHLVGEPWREDSINLYRRDELTSKARLERGEAMLKGLARSKSPIETVLAVLRDKGEFEARPLHLGNRAAIDALIATHSVIYDAAKRQLYVSRGPGVSGGFTGFDLRESFARRKPVAKGSLPRDPRVSDQEFEAVRVSARDVGQATRLIKQGDCDAAFGWLKKAAAGFREQNLYYKALGDYHSCKNDPGAAREAWRKSLALRPAYSRQVRELEEKLKP